MVMQLELAVCGVVFACAAVQSVFGVGLLVFGTPTLLILGLPFADALAYLLPCSIVVSFMQVQSTGGFRLDPFRRRVLVLVIPTVLAGTLFILLAGSNIDMKPIVGAMLVVTATLRLLTPIQARVRVFVQRHVSGFLAGLGVVHGLSNLGGGILTFVTGSVYEDKHDVRRHIAFAYGAMAMIQVVALFASTSVHVVPWLWLTLPLVAGSTYVVIGRRLFAWTRQSVYQWSLTGLIMSYGILLVTRA
jgi:hypothetical protein